jgi:hypothetical protein
MNNIVRRTSEYDYEFKYLSQTKDEYIINMLKRECNSCRKCLLIDFSFQIPLSVCYVATTKLMFFEKN